MKKERQQNKYVMIANVILAFVAFSCAFTSTIGFSIYALIAILTISIATILILYVFEKRKYRILGYVFALVMIGIIISVNITSTIGSGIEVINKYIHYMNFYADLGISSFQSNYSSSKFAYYLIFLLINWIISFISYLVLQRSVKFYFVATIIIIALLALFGIIPSVLSFFFLLVSSFSILSTHKREGSSLVQRFAIYGSIMLLCLGISLPIAKYSGSVSIEHFKLDTAASLNSVLYGNDDLPNGNLKKAQNMSTSDETMLTLTFSSDYINSLYLKGYVGTNFENNRWLKTPNSVYVEENNNGILNYLNEKGYPYNQYSQYKRLTRTQYNYNVSITYKNANKSYYYYPYNLSSSISEATLYHESEMHRTLKNDATYSFTVVDSDVSSESVVQEDWIQNQSNLTNEQSKYLSSTNQYMRFVNEVYLEIPTITKDHLKTQLDAKNQSYTIYSATTMIREYFKNNFQYDTAITPFTDFLEDFMSHKVKKANSAYFATAATYMFRALSIPARYVEGYYLASNTMDIEKGISLTGKNQHAWVEVFFGGIGWLPIEVTPTFYKSIDEGNTNTDIGGGNSDDNNQNTEDKGDESTDENDSKEDKDPEIDNKDPFENNRFGKTMKNLVGFSSIILFVLMILMVIYMHKEVVVYSRRKKIAELDNEELCRYIYSIYQEQCEKFKIEEKNVEQILGKESFDYFYKVIHRGIFGHYNLDFNERKYLIDFLNEFDAKIIKTSNIVKNIKRKYIDCTGI